jgi:hypothetical protein
MAREVRMMEQVLKVLFLLVWSFYCIVMTIVAFIEQPSLVNFMIYSLGLMCLIGIPAAIVAASE